MYISKRTEKERRRGGGKEGGEEGRRRGRREGGEEGRREKEILKGIVIYYLP